MASNPPASRRRLFSFCRGILQMILLGVLRYSYKSNPHTGWSLSCSSPSNSGFC